MNFSFLDFAKTHEPCVSKDKGEDQLSLENYQPFLTVLPETHNMLFSQLQLDIFSNFPRVLR